MDDKKSFKKDQKLRHLKGGGGSYAAEPNSQAKSNAVERSGKVRTPERVKDRKLP